MSLAAAGALAPTAAGLESTTCCGTVSIPAGPGNGTPYPSTLQIRSPGTRGHPAPFPGGKVITLQVGVSVTHASPDDFGVALTGPGGESIQLMNCVGDATDVFSVLTTFSDSASAQLPDSGAWTDGTYRPTNHCGGIGTSFYPPPGPGTGWANPGPAKGGSATLTGTFAGTEPSGTWSLYARDFIAGDGGGSLMWSLTVVTPDQPDTRITSTPPDKTKKKKVTYGFEAVPPPTAQGPATFECGLDTSDLSLQPCTSPITLNLGKRNNGRHFFQVRATIDGVADPSTAEHSFKKKKRKKKKKQ